MATTFSFEKLPSWLTSQIRLAEYLKRRDLERRRHPFVTISRQAGAGGITIGRKLALYLHEHDSEGNAEWTVFDRNLVNRVLKEHNLPNWLDEEMPEDRASEIKETMKALFGSGPSAQTLVEMTGETILWLAHLGNVILVGRGANIVTRHLRHGFHVRLIGALERRIEHVQDYYELGREQAIELIKREDGGRKRYLKANFDENIDDPLLYHMVINTDHVTYDEAVKVIGKMVLQQLNSARKKRLEKPAEIERLCA